MTPLLYTAPRIKSILHSTISTAHYDLSGQLHISHILPVPHAQTTCCSTKILISLLPWSWYILLPAKFCLFSPSFIFQCRHQVWIRNAFNHKYPKTQIAANFSNFLLPFIVTIIIAGVIYNSKISLLTYVLKWSVVLIKLHSTFSFPWSKPGITDRY